VTRSFRTTFDLDAPLDVAWQAFTTPELIETWLGPVDECDLRPGGLIRFRVPGLEELTWRIIESEPPWRLVWTEPPGPVPCERRTEVRLEETAVGTRVHLTETAFGDGPAWDAHLDGTRRGWSDSLAGLHLHLRTGVTFDRMNTFSSGLGAHFRETAAGPEAVDVTEGEFAAEAGLCPGDLVVQVGEAPVFGLGELWQFTREHAPGQRVLLTYVRDGEIRRGTGTLVAP
jgi:uncharacterized protein YndB with AHSA1/START domain